MPAWNTSGTIEAAIRSVLSQTLPDFELIVVDDGSTDETVVVVGSIADPRIQLIPCDHRGAAAARNEGVKAASAPIVSLVDSDDLLLPRYLEVMSGLVRSHPDVGFAYTDAFVFDAKSHRVRRTTATEPYRPSSLPRGPEELHLALLTINFVYNAVTLPRRIFDVVGPFDESLQATIDYEMWLRIAAHGYGAVEAPHPLAVYRSRRPDSISADHARVLANTLRVYEIADAQHPGSARARERARQRREVVSAELQAISGARSLDALRRRARHSLAGARSRVLSGRVWRPPGSPPLELTAAFPDLFPRR